MNRDALLTEANQSFAAGRLPRAMELCNQLIAANASDHQAITLLAAALVQRGAMPEAMALAERAVALQPGNAMYLYNSGKIQAMSGQHDAALATFERALQARPGFEMAIAAKAGSLDQLGRVDEALKLLEPAIARKNETIDMALIYVTLLAQRGRHKAVIPLATKHLTNQTAPDHVRARLGQALGKAYEELGDYDRAFEAFRNANRVRGRASQFDAAAFAAAVDQLIAFFTPARFLSLPRSSSASEVPVFIAGMPRSGTTLVEQIIASHPQGHGGGETTSLERISRGLPQEIENARLASAWSAPAAAAQGQAAFGLGMPDCLAHAPAAVLDRAAAQYLASVTRDAPAGALRVVDKYLRNQSLLGLAWMLFPRARAIRCLRNPMDTCFSCYISALSPVAHGWCSDLGALGFCYRQFDRLMSHWKAVLPMPMLDVQYEELVANAEPVTRQLINFTGLPWNDACLRFHEHKRAVQTLSYDQVRQPIYTKAVERYKRYEKHLGPLREALGDLAPQS